MTKIDTHAVTDVWFSRADLEWTRGNKAEAVRLEQTTFAVWDDNEDHKAYKTMQDQTLNGVYA